MSRKDDLPTSSESTLRAVPRAVIRLLRSGQLDEAKTRRVLEIHGPAALDAVGSVKAEAPEA